MLNIKRIPVRTGVAVILAGGLAACATKAPPPPPPPVVKAEPVPYRPLPPSGAAYVMSIPQRGADGVRQTVNYGLGPNETTWHFRSGMNVAALNCLGPAHQPILDAYGAMLKGHSKSLGAANSAIDKDYRSKNSSSRNAIKAREEHMTQVYNYFTIPPARGRFCGVALQIANEYIAAPPKDINAFAATNLPRLESAFEGFFQDYEKYQLDAKAWDQRYGAQYGSSQPGYVAVYGSGGMPVASSSIAGSPAPAGTVVDAETGAEIPVLSAAQGEVATPVVQPVAKDQ